MYFCNMKDTINTKMKESMKAGDKLSTLTLRSITSAFTNWEKANPGKILDHITVLNSLAKQRRQSAEEYRSANQVVLAEQEEMELQIIEQFLPAKMTDVEADLHIDAIFSRLQPSGIKDMGKVMKAFNENYAGMYDGKKLSEKIKAKLA